jgi:hypothetical protein
MEHILYTLCLLYSLLNLVSELFSSYFFTISGNFLHLFTLIVATGLQTIQFLLSNKINKKCKNFKSCEKSLKVPMMG